MNIVHRCMSSGILGLFLISLTACGGGEDGGPPGLSATLSWDPVENPNVSAYTVHYGRQSGGGDGTCDYESSFDVSSPFAIVTGLEPETTYYFAVSVHDGNDNGNNGNGNGHGNSVNRSRCSEEVSKVTPPAWQIQIEPA